MLFKRRFHDGLSSGAITMTVRRWTRPQARAGGRYRAGRIELVVERIEAVLFGEVTARDARRCGFASRVALADELGADDATPVYRIAFRAAEAHPGPPAAARRPTGDELATVAERLARMDGRSDHGAWTATTLRLIARHPGRRAADLAAAAGRERLAFKADVRRLKRLGLTESLEVGYRLTPLGAAYVRRMR